MIHFEMSIGLMPILMLNPNAKDYILSITLVGDHNEKIEMN